MALEKKQVGFPFLKGINTKQSPKAQATGELTDCVNYRMDRAGRLDRREGFQQYDREIYASDDTVGQAKALTHLKDEVILLDGENAYSRTTDGQWVDRGGLLDVRSDCSLVHSDMLSTSTNASYAVSGDFEYIAWADQPFTSEGVGTDTRTGGFARYKYMIRDRHTGATIVEPTAFPSKPFMDTRVEFGFDVYVNGATPNIARVDPPGDLSFAVAVGNYIQLGTKKRKVTAVTPAAVTVSTDFGSTVATTMHTWKDAGPDALYFAPRIRLLAPTGTKWVIALFQVENEIHYLVSQSVALGTDLPFSYKGELATTDLSRSYPAWDADWMLTNNSKADDDDIGVIVAYSGITDGNHTHKISFHSIASSGILSTEQEVDFRGYSDSGETMGAAPHSFTVADYNNPTWQPFVKVIHDDDANGVPQVSGDSQVLAGQTLQSSTLGLHTHVWLLEDDGTDPFDRVWDGPLYTSATGAETDWCLTRAGIGYDDTYIYAMSEVQDASGGGSSAGEINGTDKQYYYPQNSIVVTGRLKRSDGTLDQEKALWTNMSVHSDGFFPHGSDSGKCYWWLSGSQLTDPLNSITFLADQDGRIHGHGVKGRAAINTSLEARAHSDKAEEYAWKRNLQCGVSRVTPGRWLTSGSTEFWCGSSMAGIGSAYTVSGYPLLQHYRPSLLTWDTSPTRPLRNQEAHGILYIGGGLLWAYDGNKLCETEFLLSPHVTAAHNFSGTEVLAEGKYSYYVVFEYADDGGSRHVSAPAGPFAVTTTAGQTLGKISLWFSQLTNCRFSGTASNPASYVVKIYRTNTDGVIHYLHASLDDSAWGTGFSPDTLLFTYYDSDATQHDAMTEALIWDVIGAESAGTPISSPVDVTRHKDSLIVSNTENVVYSSTGLIPGLAAILPGLVAENAGAFGLYGDSQNERITHIASNGLVCLFFTKSDGYAFEGEGPDSRARGSWTAPIKFAPGQGVRPDGFIASTPMGIIYSSQNGIYLVANDMQMTNIGAPVADFTDYAAANDPVVRDGDSEVIIPIKGDSAIYGSALVYNYFFKQWYRYKISTTLFSAHESSNESAEWVAWVGEDAKPVMYLVDSQGHLYRQKDGADSKPYADSSYGGSPYHNTVTGSLTTSWIQFPGYGGRMRCYHVVLMGSNPEGATMDTNTFFLVRQNFGGATGQEVWYENVTPTGMGEDNSTGASEILFKLKQQKLDSMEVVVSTIGPTDERGWSPEGLLFEMGQRPIETRFKVDDDKSA